MLKETFRIYLDVGRYAQGDAMKQKMKKCLCLMLSFVFVFSNCQLFAQKVPAAEAPIDQFVVENMQNEINYYREQLNLMKEKVYCIFGDAKHAEIRMDLVTEYKKLIGNFNSYKDFISGVNTYDTYIAREAQITDMDRLADKYMHRKLAVEQFLREYPLEEGAVFQKAEEGVDEVVAKYRTIGVNFQDEVNEIYKRVEASLNYIEERLNLAENQINRIAKGNEEIYKKLLQFLEESGTTTDDIVKYAMKHIPEDDLKFLALTKETELGKVSKLRMAKQYRDYLRKIGSRSKEARSSLIRLMRNIDPEKLHARAYKAGYEDLLHDFPVLPENGYKNISKFGRRALSSMPLLVVGVVLLSAAIVEVKSDNSYLDQTLGVRKMSEIAKKIETNSNELSIGEYAAYYNSPISDSKIIKDVRHLANLINLNIAAGKATEDFNTIDNLLLQEEKSLTLLDENEYIQKTLDKRFTNMSDIVSQYDNMI